jgi:hypothetical protein
MTLHASTDAVSLKLLLQRSVTYGWLKQANELPSIVPLTIFNETRYKKKRAFSCRGHLTNYQVFTSRVKLVATTATN